MADIFFENIEALKEIITKYPYYATAQFLLAKKMKEANEADFENQYQKSLIFIPNQIWLDYLLQEKQSENVHLTETVDTQAAETSEKLSQIISSQMQNFKKEVSGEEKLFETPEPLYKTDYFKHQGIENVEAKTEKETQLGNKVKKFTDWLKEMKKLDTVTPQFSTTAAEEKEVENKALQSLEDKGVLTESMAEVLVLQGKKDKAVRIYEKLSLSNPEKSSYFASKIKFIKENNL